jgi:hypothetical protein
MSVGLIFLWCCTHVSVRRPGDARLLGAGMSIGPTMGYCPRQAWCAQAVEAMAICEMHRCHHDIGHPDDPGQPA